MFVKVKGIRKFNGKNKTKAFATLILTDGKEAITIPGFKVMDSAKGPFMGLPELKGKDGKFYKQVYPNKPLRDKMQSFVLSSYKKA